MAPSKQPQESSGIKFVLGGISCMSAALVTNPIDVIKIRLQIDGELVSKGHQRHYNGFVRGMMKVVSEEGVGGLYRGVAPSVLREGSYSSFRVGAYEPFKELFGAHDPAHTPLWKKVAAGACSGSVGAVLATPTDLVKVRMQAAGAPGQPAQRYSGIIDALTTIYRQEGGLAGLYQGWGPTTKRAAVLTASQLPAYDHTKHTLLNHDIMEEGLLLHVTASMTAGLVAALTTSPIDLVKTRVMNQPFDAQGKPTLYSSAWDCAVKSVRSEGALSLYKGFFPNWMRIGPHTIVTFLIFEQLRALVGIRPV